MYTLRTLSLLATGDASSGLSKSGICLSSVISFLMASVHVTRETFSKFLSTKDPESAFLQRDASTTSSCRQILRHTFSDQTGVGGISPSALGPLSELHVSKDFAYDQLWQQLELRNKSLLSALRRQLSALESKSNVRKPNSKVRFAPSVHPTEQMAVKASPATSLLPNSGSELKTANVEFFNESDLDAFVDDAVKLADEEKLVESDDDSEVSGEETDDENTKSLRYSDFFDSSNEQVGEISNLQKNKATELISETNPSQGNNDQQEELTPLQGAMARSKSLIEKLENDMVQPKPWHLRGEVSAFSRPKESLLETEVQHDVALRPPSLVQSDVNQAIEDIIKQRIIDDLFDDVKLALPSGYKSGDKTNSSKSQIPEVSQEKSKEGLADLYAREFTEQQESEKRRIIASTTVQRQEDEPESDAQKEVNKLFTSLAEKLDSLSNLHFTPGEVQKQEFAVSKPNVKAIINEEAIPEGVSDGDVLAPHEVFNSAKISHKGDIEMTKDERKAKRRANKVRGKKAKETATVFDKSSSHFDGVATDKRRADVALERVGKKPRVSRSKSKHEGTKTPTAVSRVIDGTKYNPQNEGGFRGTASSLKL